MYTTPYSPSSPAATPSYSSHSNRDPVSNYNNSRKRPRSDYFTFQSPSNANAAAARSPHARSSGHAQNLTHSSTLPYSPEPLANSRYRFRDGLDTPGLNSYDSNATPLGVETDSIYCRRLTAPATDIHDSYIQTPRPNALSRERNGAARLRSRRMDSGQSRSCETWGSFAWRLAAGTVNGIWNFCGNVGFNGFKAGGGQAYEFTEHAPTPIENDRDSSRSPIPGDWPSDPEYVKVAASDTPSERPAKRRQVTQEDWVLVNGQRPSPRPIQSQGAYTSALQPRQFSPAPVSNSPRSMSRSMLPRPSGHRRNSRASLAPSRTASTSFASSMPSGSPVQRPQRQASIASMRSPHALPTHQHRPQEHRKQDENRRPSISAQRPRTPGSAKKKSPKQQKPHYDPYDINNPEPSMDGRPKTPSSAETISRYQKRREKEDKKQDALYGRMSKQLQDLIQQGQAALNSKIEVSEERDATDEDGNFSGDSGVEMGYEEQYSPSKRHGRGASTASLNGRAWV